MSPTTQKQKKIYVKTGRGGSGNFRTVKSKHRSMESIGTRPNCEMLEIAPPRNKIATSGRGGAGNAWAHVLEDGVFERVMQYEKGRVQELKQQRELKHKSALSMSRPRTMSGGPSSPPGSDAASVSTGLATRKSWASRSNLDVSVAPSTSGRKKSLSTLLAPLKTTFTRRPRSSGSSVLRDDTSSFSAHSHGDSIQSPVHDITIGSPTSHHTGSPTTPGMTFGSPLSVSPTDHVTFYEEYPGGQLPRRRSTGGHRSPRHSRLAAIPPLPSPSVPLPPLPMLSVQEGRPSRPPPRPTTAPSYTTPAPVAVPKGKSKVASIPLKTLKTTAAPIPPPSSSYNSSPASSQDMLSVPSKRIGVPIALRAPNRRMYNAAIAARSVGALPIIPREESFYAGSDTDRIDPFLSRFGAHGVEESFESIMPWIDIPEDLFTSVSSLSISSMGDRQRGMVSA